ncbi:MAG: hypothetical protein DYG92_14320 [Leptolyngbya sp. PLA1]|nr:hypothetical protein [Leptolyngbya sp. PLA1]
MRRAVIVIGLLLAAAAVWAAVVRAIGADGPTMVAAAAAIASVVFFGGLPVVLGVLSRGKAPPADTRPRIVVPKDGPQSTPGAYPADRTPTEGRPQAGRVPPPPGGRSCPHSPPNPPP